MTTKEFEAELQTIDPRVTIRPNANRPGLANVFIGTGEVCPCPAEEIRDEPDPTYVYAFPNGSVARHKSRREVTDALRDTLRKIEDPDTAALFFSND